MVSAALAEITGKNQKVYSRLPVLRVEEGSSQIDAS